MYFSLVTPEEWVRIIQAHYPKDTVTVTVTTKTIVYIRLEGQDGVNPSSFTCNCCISPIREQCGGVLLSGFQWRYRDHSWSAGISRPSTQKMVKTFFTALMDMCGIAGYSYCLYTTAEYQYDLIGLLESVGFYSIHDAENRRTFRQIRLWVYDIPEDINIHPNIADQ